MVCKMLMNLKHKKMKSFVSFLALLAVLGCRTPEFEPQQAAIVALHGGVESWNGQAWVAAHPNQLITNGAKIRSSADSFADLSAAKSLTLRSSGACGLDLEPPAAWQPRHQDVTQTVLVVERGCVLASIANLSPSSVFEIHGDQVVAQLRGADFSTSAHGTVAWVAGQVSVTAGEKSSLFRQDADLTQPERKIPRPHLANPSLDGSESLSPFERGLACARHGWY